MKKTVIALALAGMAFAASTQAAPQSGTWYTGAKLGWSQYYSLSDDSNMTVTDTKKNNVGGGIFGGYQFNPWLAAELGYDYMGNMRVHTLHDGDGRFSSQGIQLTGKLSYPLPIWNNSMDIYTRLGIMGYRADMRNLDNTHFDHNGDKYGVAPVAALGAEYAFNDHWSGRMEYQWVGKMGKESDTGMKADNGMLSLGVAYHFGEAAPVPAPIPAPAPEVETKHFTLTSDVLFNFNKATLKAEGQQALQKLYSQIGDMGLTNQSMIVIGYTDRIGSDAYNMKLSKERAQSVADYLEQLGAPANIISVEGRGKADPVTGTKCDGIHNRNALIACLAPDRRVDIEVQGTKAQVVDVQQAQ